MAAKRTSSSIGPYGDGAEAARPGIPEWVPHGQEERWRNSEKVARDMMGGDDAAVWSTARVIFHDRTSYPD